MDIMYAQIVKNITGRQMTNSCFTDQSKCYLTLTPFNI